MVPNDEVPLRNPEDIEEEPMEEELGAAARRPNGDYHHHHDPLQQDLQLHQDPQLQHQHGQGEGFGEVSFRCEFNERERDERLARANTQLNVSKYVRCSQSHIETMLRPLFEQFEAKENAISDREFVLIETRKENQMLIIENQNLQNQLEQYLAENDARQRQQPQLYDELHQPAHLHGQQQHQHAMIVQNQNAMVSFLQDMGYETVESVKEHLQAMETLRERIDEYKSVLQDSNRQVQQLRSKLADANGKLRTSTMRMEYLEDENAGLKRKLTILEANALSNSYSRLGMTQRPEQRENVEFQTMERCCPSTASRRRASGLKGALSGEHEWMDYEGEKEMARGDSKNSLWEVERKKEESMRTAQGGREASGYYMNEHKWDLGPHIRHNSTYSPEMMVMRELLNQQHLPEPPEFNGDNKVSTEAFAKAFKLKYGSCTEEQQLVILETKFLKGRALKIFRALSDRYKTSVRNILTEIAARLRVSPEDETRRAKTKWEMMTKRSEQSYEDFCLEIDEVAKRAFSRAMPAEIASFKINKLLNSITDETLFTLLDHKLPEVEEESQYEVGRAWVTKHENAQKERKERMKMIMGNEKRRGQHAQSTQNQPGPQGYSTNSIANTPRSAAAPQYNPPPPENGQLSRNQANMGNTGDMNQTWREKLANNSNTQKPTEFFACQECKWQRGHEPSCSRAPEQRRKLAQQNATCFRCHEKGHYATQCTKVMGQQGEATAKTPEKIVGSVTEQLVLAVPSREENGKEKSKGVRMEKGRIGCAEVELMLDSGACISLLPVKMWEDIKKRNGPEWVKGVKVEPSRLSQAYAANDQPIKLIECVTLETAMQSRTREVVYYVAVCERESLILGIDHFDKMGIKMSFEERPREVKICKDIRMVPSESKVVDIQIEGVLGQDESLCLISPLVECLSASVCKFDRDGRAVVKLSNFGQETLLLRKGEIVATGELDGFEVLRDDQNAQRAVSEYLDALEVDEEVEPRIQNINENSSEARWKLVCEHLNKPLEVEGWEKEVWKVIEEFQNIFATDDNELGRTHATECKIELKEGTEPLRQRPRPIPLAIRPEIKKMLDKMLAQGVIRESTSPWSSPVVLVKKKDGSIRMCIDYRRVNKVVKNNAHPLPHIEATLQSLVGKKVFSTFDCLAGYWQIPLEERSKEVTAFAIGSELFEFNVLPFGLVTSPAVFQGTMESIVGDLLGVCAFVYVDDLLVASESVERHVEDVAKVLKRIEDSGLQLRAKKCRIAQMEVEYLGHKITPEGVKTEELKVEKMRKFAKPTNAKELQSFLGLVGYYRKFVMNFAQTAAPLTPLTSAKTVWCWGVEQETAFQKLITAVCSTPVLKQPDTEAAVNGNRPFHIYTDASRIGVGAVLSQEGEDGMEHPIAFTSKSLSPAESRYHITDLEALAMMHALRRFKVIVYGTPVVIFTDHKPLIYLLKGSPLADRLLRWSIELLEYNVRIVYVAGKANVVADALSRGGATALNETDMTEIVETIEPLTIVGEVKVREGDVSSLETDSWLEMLRKEEGWGELIQLLEQGVNTGGVKVPGVKKGVQVENYMLIGKSLRNVEREECSRVVVPQSVCVDLVQEAHAGQLAGHFGTDKMWKQLSQRFFFPKMRAVIEKVVKSCTKCLCVNDHPKLIAPLKPYETSYPLEVVACDLVEVGLSTQGNKYLLTIIDLFTKFGQAVPIPDKRAETVLKAFVQHWALGEGRVPDTLLTDQGKEFANEHFQKFTEMLGIRHAMTKGYNSRANGAVERFNKTIMRIMAKKATVPLEWDETVPFAIFAYNNSAHVTTGEAPNFLMNGRDSKGPLKITGDDAVGIRYADIDEYKHLMVQELGKAHKLARESAELEWERNKRLFDEKYKTATRKYPQPGSRVLIEIPSEKLGAKCPKLVNKWKGPYRVLSCSENSATVVPVFGKGKDVLVIPFDNIRVLPAVMESVPIETVKGRAQARGNIVGSLDNEQLSTPNDNDVLSCRQLYCCKCPIACSFWPADAPKLRTTSPTQLCRIINLLAMDDKYKRTSTREILLMTQEPTPMISGIPTLEVFHILSSCSSLKLVCDEVEGWAQAYSNVQNQLRQEHFGDVLMKTLSTQVVLCDGVDEAVVPLAAPQLQKLKSTDHVQELHNLCNFRKPQVLLMVVPMSVDREEILHWNSLIKAVPKSTMTIVVPSYMTEYDFEEMKKYAALMTEVARDEGKIHVLLPDDKAGSRNQPLHSESDNSSIRQYWKTVLHMLELANYTVPDVSVKAGGEVIKESDGPSTAGDSGVHQMASTSGGHWNSRHGRQEGWRPRRGTSTHRPRRHNGVQSKSVFKVDHHHKK